MTVMQHYLQVKDLKKEYVTGIPVLKGINFNIDAAGIIAIIGPSGTGKSTLLRCINRLVTPSSGEIFINNQDTAKAGGKALRLLRRQVGMVFQEYNLVERLSVIENVLCGRLGYMSSWQAWRRKFSQQDINTAFELLAAVGLTDQALNRADSLSGGQRQRVAIGRAIVRKPKIFLFDEPLSNLDAALRVDMRLELSRLHQELQATMLYVTHDQVEAMTLADKVVILNDGRIEQVGSPLELYDKPKNMFVAGFIGMPKMSFLQVTVTAMSEGNVTLKLLAGAEITLSRPVLNVSIGSQLTMGIRPEHIKLCDLGSATIQANLEISEQLGSESYVYVETTAAEEITVRVDGEQPIAPRGTQVGLFIPPAKCHLFDNQGLTI